MSQGFPIHVMEMSTPTITSQTTIAEITNLLARSGCPNITHLLDLPNCSRWRVNGGGQGDIHEGALVDGARVAIKISRGDQSIDTSKGDKSFKRVAHELHTWFTLDHPNIAKLLGMAVFQDRIAMISPWIMPGDFYKFINEFPDADRMDICLQVASGLAYLHETRVIFGDLKAQNVLIGPDGVAKLTDFGLSIIEKSRILKFSTTSTTGGGSARWMAPELIESSTDRTAEADVYALSMTFIEILTGNFPFPDINDDIKVMFAVLYRRTVPDRPSRLKMNSLRHREWWRLLTYCWDTQPSSRPKAADWGSLDQALAARRALYLSNRLKYVLCYGRTKSGPLKNRDTGQCLLPTAFATTTFFVSELVEKSGPENHVQSKGATLQTLMIQYAPAIDDTKHPNPDVGYVLSLQDLIYKGIEERVQQVRRWITSNMADFPPNNQEIRNLFAILDNKLAPKMKAAARICATICSSCMRPCLQVYGHMHGTHKCVDHTPNPLTYHFMRSRSSNIYSQLAAEDAAHCIQVQDLDHLLMGSRLPSRDSVVLGIEWQSGWYLPHESLVLLVREGPQSNGGQGIWWIRLARFLGHDFITPHRNVHPVQRPRIVVRAEMDMGSTGRLVFGHVVQVVDSLRRTMSHYSDLKMDSWFYAATIFKLLASQGLPTPAGIEKRLMYEDHPTANRVQREQFQEIFNRVERLLEAESWSRSHVEAPEPPGPSLQLSVPYKLGRRAGRYTRPIRIIPISGWERLKSQLDSSKPDPEELSKTVAICDETEKNSQT